MLNKLKGKEIREKLFEELSLEKKDDLILKPLNLKHIKESGLNFLVDGVDEKRFSSFNLSDEDKIYLASSFFLSLDVKEKLSEKIISINNSNIHLTIHAHPNSNLDLILLADYDSSLFVEAFLDSFSFVRLTILSKSGSIMTRFYSNCKENARFEAINFSSASLNSFSKSTLSSDSSCYIANSYFNKDSSSKSNDIVIHSGKNTNSLIASRGYLVNSKSDFRGLIKIEPSAFDSQGFQESAILLEGNSKAISVPDLEILNNEVKCSHGSTISRVKDEDLFYFESRGISKTIARFMLVEGHLLSLLPDDSSVRDRAKSLLEEVFL
jgi:hypothetical protein